MLKKCTVLVIALCMVLALVPLRTQAADPPHSKSMIFKDNQVINGSVAASGNNMKSLVSGDVLKLKILGKGDPNIGIDFVENIDTSTYKILAMKVKKEYAGGGLEGEIFYNVKGQGAVGGKSTKFLWAEGTDWQWIYVDLGAANAGDVGFIRFDPYDDSPVENTMITVAGIGFFKTVDDMNAFAATPDGQNLGSNEGDRDFPVEVPFSGTDLNIGIWLNTVSDPSKPGHYWIRFNAAAPFYGINFYLYASKNNAKGHWALYKFDTSVEQTLAGEPVAREDLSLSQDTHLQAAFEPMNPGQYIFYVELEPDQDPDPTVFYYVVACSSIDAPEGLIEYGFNGTKNPDYNGPLVMAGTVMFVETEGVNDYLIPLDAENPTTGDVGIIAYGFAALAAVLVKRRKVK